MSQICRDIHILFNSIDRYCFPYDKTKIPRNGIYILFEKGETGHSCDRIVRVGINKRDDQLRTRLEGHYIIENKDRSIFRKNIGRAILNKKSDPFLDQWNLEVYTKEEKERYKDIINIEKLIKTEKEVTDYIQNNISFVVFTVADKDTRLELESKIISTVSLCEECQPSDNWLGLYSPKEKIRESGLWLENELYKEPLSELEIEILRTIYCSK